MARRGRAALLGSKHIRRILVVDFVVGLNGAPESLAAAKRDGSLDGHARELDRQVDLCNCLF